MLTGVVCLMLYLAYESASQAYNQQFEFHDTAPVQYIIIRNNNYSLEYCTSSLSSRGHVWSQQLYGLPRPLSIM